MTDHPQDLGRRGFPLQRLLNLTEEPCVLDGNDGLVGKGLDELDLASGELAPFAPRQRKPPDHRIPAAQRDAQNCPIAHQRLEFGVIIEIGRDVADVHHFLRQ